MLISISVRVPYLELIPIIAVMPLSFLPMFIGSTTLITYTRAIVRYYEQKHIVQLTQMDENIFKFVLNLYNSHSV